MAFSALPGVIAEELEANGIPAYGSIEAISDRPDIIHGHHLLETLIACLRFPSTPAISVCHGALPWVERPPKIPSIRRYVAVDLACRERVVKDVGIEASRVPLVHNFVDLNVFRPRGPLPAKPERALIFSNYASENAHLPFVREACRRTGIAVEVVGESSGNAVTRPSEVLGEYDLVFAKGRAALEALAVGCSVILCDATGCGPMVQIRDIERMRDWNFGFRLLTEPLLPRSIERQIALYDAGNAGQCRDYVRATCGIEAAVDRLMELYEEVIDDAQTNVVGAGLVADAAASELTRMRHEMGDQMWRFDPPRTRPVREKKGRVGRKLRAIGFRFGELIAEFRPRRGQ